MPNTATRVVQAPSPRFAKQQLGSRKLIDAFSPRLLLSYKYNGEHQPIGKLFPLHRRTGTELRKRLCP